MMRPSAGTSRSVVMLLGLTVALAGTTCKEAVQIPGSPGEVAAALPAERPACWDPLGSVVSCALPAAGRDRTGTGAVAYKDNADGTITDVRSGLVWEKLSDDDSIHDKDSLYTWDDALNVKVAALNSERFASFGDWRLPSAEELMSILDAAIPFPAPAVNAAFNHGACAGHHSPSATGCSVLTCSCTVSNFYWSASRDGLPQYGAWNVGFSVGFPDWDFRARLFSVRAVRGGP